MTTQNELLASLLAEAQQMGDADCFQPEINNLTERIANALRNGARFTPELFGQLLAAVWDLKLEEEILEDVQSSNPTAAELTPTGDFPAGWDHLMFLLAPVNKGIHQNFILWLMDLGVPVHRISHTAGTMLSLSIQLMMPRVTERLLANGHYPEAETARKKLLRDLRGQKGENAYRLLVQHEAFATLQAA